MKKASIVVSLFIVISFSTCSLFNNDLAEFLAYYSSNADIEFYTLDGSYPMYGGLTHIPSGSDRYITFSVNNPNNLDLAFDVVWKDQYFINNPPQKGVDYSLTKLNTNSVQILLKKDFLEDIDRNVSLKNVSVELSIATSDYERKFDSYSFNLVINTPPELTEVSIVKSEDIGTWVLAFDLPSKIERQGVHSDILAVNINNVDYPISFLDNGSIVVDTALTTSLPAVGGRSALLIDESGSPLNSSPDTVYYITTMLTSDIPSITLRLVDARGAYSDEITVTNLSIEYTDETTGTNLTPEYTDHSYFSLNTSSEITGYTGSEKNVIIPPTINGKKVTTISKNAFKETDIETIVIPQGVTYIGDSAFCDCTELTSITIPDTVATIEAIAFLGCGSLATVYTDWTKKNNGYPGGANPYPEYDSVSNTGWSDSFNSNLFDANWVLLNP